MGNLVPSRWGRPLEQYTNDYDIIEARQLFVWVDQIQQVKSDIEKVSTVTDSNHPHNITILTLKSILRLSYSPKYLHLLGSPLLFRGCIRLMASVKTSGKTSPFSYEFGYLCFRILTISLSVHLLEVGECLPYTIARMLDHLGIETLVTLSQCIARLMKGLIGHGAGPGRETYNCLFGWSTCPKHPTKDIVVTQLDARTLSGILYEDRHAFLKAMASTFSPGLSAVIYLIWRDVCYTRSFNEPCSTKLVIPFFEIYWRYLLVATDDQYDTLYGIQTWDLEFWRGLKPGSLAADLEESRDLMQTFINRLTQTAPHLYEPFPLEAITAALYFLSIHAQTGCESLLPRVLAVTIERIWDALERKEESNATSVDIIMGSFDFFGDLLEPLIPENSLAKEASMMRVINELVKGNLLDLIGRGIFLLNPVSFDCTAQVAGEEQTRNLNFLRASQSFCALLPKLAPRAVVDNGFENLDSVWWRVHRQLQFLEILQPAAKGPTPQSQYGFYRYDVPLLV
ncbi:hypothetical protein RSOL_134940 [Rhizoctonia solani AG-3 Rhs1AP]|uniref:Uncharacterized protein n=1 Tax=Rhizoctonia solani AG-3 Rhs1AP TaxID=1086054 RepID=X8J186_9AGAM|nr:hypothetical protein RSOL_134940 [Rhizoctonia solani AG-3 Rhs1AP]